MEFFALLMAVGWLLYLEERDVRRRHYPDGTCLHCPMRVSFHWRHREWVHEDGSTWAPSTTAEVEHLPYPSHRYEAP